MRRGDADDLRATHARRQELEAEAVGLQAEMTAVGVEGTSPALAIQRIRTEIAEIDVMVSAELTRANAQSLPTAEEVTLREDGLRKKREDVRRRRQVLDGALEAQNKIVSDLIGTRGRFGGAQEEIQKSLTADLAVLPDEDRTRLIGDAAADAEGARVDHRTKAAALEEQRGKAPSPDEVERRRIRVERLQRSLKDHELRMGALGKEIANLEGQIQNAGGDGLGEKVETLAEERDLTDREIERHEGRIATLALLKETIESCYQEQRDRLHAPLRRHLRPFLNDVFPSAELELRGSDSPSPASSAIRRDPRHSNGCRREPRSRSRFSSVSPWEP